MRDVVDGVDTVLRPVGFARRKAVWNRRHDPLIDVVDLQVSKGGDAVTLNCGVLDPVVHVIAWSSDVPQFVQEPDCTVRARIGDLFGDRLDVWWQLADSSEAATELASLTGSTVIPFLDAMHDPDAFDEFLALSVAGKRWPDQATQVYRAVRLSERGDHDGARELLGTVGEISGGWRQRANEVAAKLASRRPG